MISSVARVRSTNQQPPRSAHTSAWYQDGSVVLQARDTQFRVHFGVLASQSTFFREMQGLPQPPDQPTVECCQVVEMQDDVFDVKHLLTAIYDPTFLAQTAIPLPYIASLIRLGRKYEFRKLLDSAMERLTFKNPTTLSEYEARMTKNKQQYLPTRIVPFPSIILDILTLAREHDILTALPCAYYRALTLPQALLFDGIPRGDGTVSSLAQADQRQCVLSYQKLLGTQFRPGYSLAWVNTWKLEDDCDSPEECNYVRKLDLYFLWFPLPTALFSGFEYASCEKRTRDAIKEGREKAWDELPSFFGLPPWNELKNDL
ncbi:hypothetical protein C8F04DRAFT_1236791 [Mycena alexandri]|uniref:BTB domain-containing protein n=1 Tax=Mycena alexandri TaxID=1745969 RepID=A0AAD6SPA0_9AGAR|nr:hypothetical protein C8F04DRAFT_1236791 [Mycena alexandri]